MFPNFAACLELNHSCNEEREERSGELSTQSQERTKNHVCECHRQQFQCTAHTWPSEGDHSPNYLGDSWQSVLCPHLQCCLFPGNATDGSEIESLSMLEIPVKSRTQPCDRNRITCQPCCRLQENPTHFCSMKCCIQHQDGAEGVEQVCRAGGTMHWCRGTTSTGSHRRCVVHA